MLVPTRLFCVGGIAAFVLGAQEPAKPDSPTPEEQLSALIEKTNAMESFVARYHFESSANGDGELKFQYSRGRLRLDASSKKDELKYVIAEERMTLHHQNKAEGDVFATASLLPIPSEVLEKGLQGARKLLPDGRIEDLREALHGEAHLGFSVDEAGNPQIDYGADAVFGKTKNVLSWLPFLQHKAHFLSEESGNLVFEGDAGSRFVLQKTTGFLESAQISSNGESRSLKLIQLDLEPEIGANTFDHFGSPPGVRDESRQLEAHSFWTEASGLRLAILLGAVEQYRGGEAAWDDAAKSSLRRALEGWDASILDLQVSERAEAMQPYYDKLFWWFQRRCAEANGNEERAKGEAEIEKAEGNVRKDLERLREWGQKGLQDIELDSKISNQKEMVEMLGIDRAAFDAAFAEHAEKPVLEYFAAQVALAREGKLTNPENR